MNRRNFFTRLASGLFVASAPTLFLPKIVKPGWRPTRIDLSNFHWDSITYYRGVCEFDWVSLWDLEVIREYELIRRKPP